MDKALFRAYVKELVKEQIEESVEKIIKKILPNILGEAVAEIKGSQRVVESSAPPKQKFSKAQLAQMMGLERIGDAISASTERMRLPDELPPNVDISNPHMKPAVDAINRDYSALMKQMGISK